MKTYNKLYLFNDSLITKIISEKELEYRNSIKEVEDGGTIIYVSNKINNFLNDEEILNFFDSRDHKNKYLKENYFFITKLNNEYIYTHIGKTFINDIRNIKKTFIIKNFLHIFLDKININKLQYHENLDYIFHFKISKNENILISLSGNPDNKKYRIEDILKLTDNETKNKITDIKRNKSKFERLIKFISNKEEKILKDLVTEGTKELISTIYNIDNKFGIVLDGKEHSDNYLQEHIGELIYKVEENDIFSNLDDKSDKIYNANDIYTKIKNQKLKTFIYLLVVFGIGLLINAYLYFYTYPNLKELNEMKFNQIKTKNTELKKRFKEIKAQKIFDLYKKTYNNEWTNFAYLKSYLNHFNIKINSSTIKNKNNNYIAYISITGMLPDDILNYMKQNLGLINYQLIVNNNQYKEGLKYMLEFDMSKFSKSIKTLKNM